MDIHTGSVCWDSKFPVYVLYATAVDEDIIVIHHQPAHDWNPPLPGPGREVFSNPGDAQPDDDDDKPIFLSDADKATLAARKE